MNMCYWEPNIVAGIRTKVMNIRDKLFPHAFDILGTEANNALASSQQQKELQIFK